MKHRFLSLTALVAWLAAVLLATAADSRDTIQTLGELDLADGRTLHRVRIISVGSDHVIATWDGGMGSLAFAQFPPDLAAHFAARATPVTTATEATVIDDDAVARKSADLAAKAPVDVKLAGGFVMHGSRILRWHPDSVDIAYVGGTVPIKFNQVTPADRKALLAIKAEQLRRQGEEDERLLDQTEADRHATQERRRAQQRAFRMAAEQGLKPGMTTDEVRAILGPETRQDDEYRGPSQLVHLIYINRPGTPEGYYTELNITMKDGVMLTMSDSKSRQDVRNQQQGIGKNESLATP